MKYDNFLTTYDINFLSSIDRDVHNKMLNRFISLYKQNKPNQEAFILFDIGCNAGSFIKEASQMITNPVIHAFEPHPYLYEYLNSAYTEHYINNYCVSDYTGLCKINIPSLSVGISSIIDRVVFDEIRKSQEVYSLESKCITIDEYCSLNKIEKIDFIKIDVEGAEYMVFTGAKKMLSEGKILSGQFEVGINESGYSTDDIINLLEGFGYSIDRILANDFFFYKK